MKEPAATNVQCPECGEHAEITKYSPEHTLTRWTNGRAHCKQLAHKASDLGVGRCAAMSTGTRRAFDAGKIDLVDREPGT